MLLTDSCFLVAVLIPETYLLDCYCIIIRIVVTIIIGAGILLGFPLLSDANYYCRVLFTMSEGIRVMHTVLYRNPSCISDYFRDLPDDVQSVGGVRLLCSSSGIDRERHVTHHLLQQATDG